MCNELNLIELEKLENEIIKNRNDIKGNVILKINSMLDFLIKAFEIIKKYHKEKIELYISDYVLSDYVLLVFNFKCDRIELEVNNNHFIIYCDNKVYDFFADLYKDTYKFYLLNFIYNIDIKEVEKRVINALKEKILIK